MSAALRRPRLSTPQKTFTFGTRKEVRPRPQQRFCDGCKRRLGDATPYETQCIVARITPPSVVEECPVCTPNPPGLEWRLALVDVFFQPYVKLPLSDNDGDGGRSDKERYRIRALKKYLRGAACDWARHVAKIPPLAAMQVDLVWTPARGGRRDPKNANATLKPLEDGLVDAGLVPDDTPLWSPPQVPIITEPDAANPGLALHVTEVRPERGTR